MMENITSVYGGQNATDSSGLSSSGLSSSGLSIHILTLVIYSTLLTIGTIGNLVVMVTTLLSRRLHTVVSVFVLLIILANLLMLLFNMPLHITSKYYYQSWTFGKACYILKFTESTAPTIIVLSLCIMSYERYICLLRSVDVKHEWSRCKMAVIVSVIVIVACARGSLKPALTKIYQSHNNTMTGEEEDLCTDEKDTLVSTSISLAGFVLFYCVALLVTVLIYLKTRVQLQSPAYYSMTLHNPERMRQRKRLARVTVAIVTVYAVTYLPSYLIYMLYLNTKFQLDTQQTWFWVLEYVSNVFMYSFYAVSPLIYCVRDSWFKLACEEVCCCCCRGHSTPTEYRGRSYRRSSSWAFSINGPMSVIRRFSRSMSIAAMANRHKSVDEASEYDNLTDKNYRLTNACGTDISGFNDIRFHRMHSASSDTSV